MLDKLQIHCQSTEANQKIVAYSPILRGGTYRYPLWGMSGNAQTLYAASVRRAPETTYTREVLESDRGHELALDWAETGEIDDGMPTVIILPGIIGNSQKPYVRNLVALAKQRGWRAVVVNWPGCDSKLKSPSVFLLGETRDLDIAFRHIRQRTPPQSRLFAVGFSLGGNALCRYADEEGDRTPLSGIVCLGQGFDCWTGLPSLKDKWLYNWNFVNMCQEFVQIHQEVFRPAVDVDHVLRAKYIFEFDEHFHCKLHGITLEEYYKKFSSHESFRGIRIPTLVLNALDDPIVEKHMIPIEDYKSNENVLVVVTPHGGHNSWLEGFGVIPNKYTLMDRLSLEFMAAVDKVNTEAVPAMPDQTESLD